MIILGIPCPSAQAGIWQLKTAGFSLRTNNEHIKYFLLKLQYTMLILL
jgi:hypothetical protein